MMNLTKYFKDKKKKRLRDKKTKIQKLIEVTQERKEKIHKYYVFETDYQLIDWCLERMAKYDKDIAQYELEVAKIKLKLLS